MSRKTKNLISIGAVLLILAGIWAAKFIFDLNPRLGLDLKGGVSLVYEAKGMRSEADRAIARLREIALASESAHQLDLVDAFLARAALIRGDLAAARGWLETSATTSWDFIAPEQPLLTHAKVLIAVGTPATLGEADRLLRDYVALARSRHMQLALIEGLAVQALLHQTQGDSAWTLLPDSTKRAVLFGFEYARCHQAKVPIEPRAVRGGPRGRANGGTRGRASRESHDTEESHDGP